MSTFSVLAEPSRRALLDTLLDGPKSVSALVQCTGMSQPVVSKHLRILREAGLVNRVPDGQRRLYSVNPEPVAAIDVWLQPYRHLLSQRLDALETHLDQTAKRSKKPKA